MRSIHYGAIACCNQCHPLPELFDFCKASYGITSILKFGAGCVQSQEGAQQGDPLGPLLFSLTLHPLLEGLLSDLRIAYLDDISLGGDGVDLALDLERIIASGKEIGLQLNIGKCEIIKSPDFADRTDFQDFIDTSQANACLLGAPLSTGPAMDLCLSSRCNDLSRAVDRLNWLSSHDALIILKSALSTPKLVYTMRSSPCTNHVELERFDSILRSGLSSILNTNITDIGHPTDRRRWSGYSQRCSLGTISLFGLSREHARTPSPASSIRATLEPTTTLNWPSQHGGLVMVQTNQAEIPLTSKVPGTRLQ